MRASSILSSARNSPQVTGKALAYATSLLRRSDSDAFYPSFFYASEVRPAYLAIRALNVELATIDDQVSNAMVGRLRYQWWRDAIKGAFDSKPPYHPLAQLLASLPQTSHLSPYHFTRLINAREAHFLNPSFSSLQDLAEYSAGTQASLLYLLLQATAAPLGSAKGKGRAERLPHAVPFEHLGGEHEEEDPFGTAGVADGGGAVPLTKAPDSLTLDHAASHLAVAMTIAILLRSIPHHASKRISVIPAEIASRYALKDEELFRRGPSAPGLRESVATLVGIAEAELRTSRACFDGTTGIPDGCVPVFLSGTPARSFLSRLASDKIEFDVFNADVQKRYWKLPFQVWADARNKRY